jgi:hypothetical protein
MKGAASLQQVTVLVRSINLDELPILVMNCPGSSRRGSYA